MNIFKLDLIDQIFYPMHMSLKNAELVKLRVGLKDEGDVYEHIVVDGF